MTDLPSDKQSADKRKPSRTAFLCAAFGIVAIAITAFLFGCEPSNQNQAKTKTGQESSKAQHDSIEAIFDTHQSDLHDRLMEDYPLGYALFYMEGKTISFREGPRNDVTVDWNTAKISQLYPDTIDLRIPLVKASSGHSDTNVQFIIPRKLLGKIKLERRPVATYVEAIFVTKQGELYAIGFSPK